MNVKIYHNPRCSKSRQTLDLLKEKNLEIDIIDYLNNPLSKDEIIDIIDMLDIAPQSLLRKGEEEYKELVSKEGKPNSSMTIDWIHRVPKLMERPIVVNGNKAKIGRPPEDVLEIL